MSKLSSLLATLAISLLVCSVSYADKVNQSNSKQKDSQQNKKAISPRVIALAPHIVEMLFDVGAGEQIIGTTGFADYPKQAEDIPRVGNYVRLQIEKVIELQPDIIFAWKSGNPSDDLERLSKLGFNIVYSQPNSFADIAKEMRQFAQLTGHKAQGDIVAAQFLQDLAKLEQQYHDKTPVNLFYELWSRPLTTVAKGSWPQQHINICRGHNAFEQAETPYPQVNIEKVLQAPIDVIIQPLSENQKDREGFNWEDWTSINAVKNNQIIKPDADALHRMTKRSLVELTKLCAEIDKVRISKS